MKSYRVATWILIGMWGILNLTDLNYNGPFFDEGIYITAGQRTLEGFGLSDRYLTWFGGFLTWPVLAAVGYNIAGLVGARAMALLLGVSVLLAVARATENLFDRRKAFWATLALSINGPFLAVSRLAVYDILSLAAIAVSFWALTEMERQDNRAWLALAAIAFGLGALSKYPMAIMILPLVAVLVSQRRSKSVTDLVLFGFMGSGFALAVFLPVREQLAGFIEWRLSNSPAFGVSSGAIAFSLLYYSAPVLLLALWGWSRASGKKRLATILLSTMLIWPAYHIWRADPVSSSKHIVFGFVFVFPLVGVAIDQLWESGKLPILFRRSLVFLLVITLLGIGLVQANKLDQGWPDLRLAAAYLVSHTQPGDQLLINESWPFTMYLYDQGKIESPWDVYDAYRVTGGQLEREICSYDWFVDSRNVYDWPQEVLLRIEQCGVFEQVFFTTTMVTGLGNDLRFHTYPIDIVIWQNVGKELVDAKGS